MKYCSKCGNELLDEAVMCPKCGYQTECKKTLTPEQKKQSTGAIAGGILLIISISLQINALYVLT